MRALVLALICASLAACQVEVVAPGDPGTRPQRPNAVEARACRVEAQRIGLNVTGVRNFSPVRRQGRVIGATAVVDHPRAGRPLLARCTYIYRTQTARIGSV